MFINYYMLNIANFLLLSDGFLLYSFNKFYTFSGRLLSLEIIVILFSNHFKADGYMKTFSRTDVSPRERTVSPVESIDFSLLKALVYLGYHNKIPQMECIKQRAYFSASLKPGIPRSQS